MKFDFKKKQKKIVYPTVSSRVTNEIKNDLEYIANREKIKVTHVIKELLEKAILEYKKDINK